MSDVMRVHGFSVHVFHRFLLKGWREGSRNWTFNAFEIKEQ